LRFAILERENCVIFLFSGISKRRKSFLLAPRKDERRILAARYHRKITEADYGNQLLRL
jgi:hypothetical protein